MNFLRSHLFIAIVSLFVLTGYGYAVFGDCCPHHEQAQSGQSQSVPRDQTPGSDDECQCICQQIMTAHTPARPPLSDMAFVPVDFVTHADEFPPDMVPQGIDYPPQLA